MSIEARREYYKAIMQRYKQAGKKLKTLILNEFCENCEYSRKYAIRLLSRLIKAPKSKAGRKPIYTPETIHELKKLWFVMDQMCSKRLKQALPLWLPFYSAVDHVKEQLLAMSPATIDRYLKPYRSELSRHKHSGTKPGSLIKSKIPIQPMDWNVQCPGFAEADSVAHCGHTLEGSFVWSITLTDIFTTWTENRAVWNKGAKNTVAGVEDIEKNLPFPLLGFDSDNGSEFLNHHLINYFTCDNTLRVQLFRSRPYKKNDNAHVEQKNWTHVRQIFGYHRIDNPDVVDLMNDLYKNELSILNNFFSPSIKLIRKTRIGAKIKKEYDLPQTPYQRLLNSKTLSPEQLIRLDKLYVTQNPFKLKKSMESNSTPSSLSFRGHPMLKLLNHLGALHLRLPFLMSQYAGALLERSS